VSSDPTKRTEPYPSPVPSAEHWVHSRCDPQIVQSPRRMFNPSRRDKARLLSALSTAVCQLISAVAQKLVPGQTWPEQSAAVGSAIATLPVITAPGALPAYRQPRNARNLSCPYRSSTCEIRELACHLHYPQSEQTSMWISATLGIATVHISGDAISR
jgi:hypothetical protein